MSIYILTEKERYSPNRVGGGESYIRRLLKVSKQCGVDIKVLLIDRLATEIGESKYENHIIFKDINKAIKYAKMNAERVILFNLSWSIKLKFIFYKNVYLLNLFYPSSQYIHFGRFLEVCLMKYSAVIVPSIRLDNYFKAFGVKVFYLPPIITDEYTPKNRYRNHKYGFIGRLDPRKGVQKILNDFSPDLMKDMYISYIK